MRRIAKNRNGMKLLNDLNSRIADAEEIARKIGDTVPGLSIAKIIQLLITAHIELLDQIRNLR